MTVLFVADEGVADDGFFATYQARNATESRWQGCAARPRRGSRPRLSKTVPLSPLSPLSRRDLQPRRVLLRQRRVPGAGVGV